MNTSSAERVLLTLIDPWDFVTDNGSFRTGTIVSDPSLPDGTLKIQLDEPLRAAGKTADIVFVRSRLVGTPITALRAGRVFCNGSSDFSGTMLKPGPFAFLCDIQLLSTD